MGVMPRGCRAFSRGCGLGLLTPAAGVAGGSEWEVTHVARRAGKGTISNGSSAPSVVLDEEVDHQQKEEVCLHQCCDGTLLPDRGMRGGAHGMRFAFFVLLTKLIEGEDLAAKKLPDGSFVLLEGYGVVGELFRDSVR